MSATSDFLSYRIQYRKRACARGLDPSVAPTAAVVHIAADNAIKHGDVVEMRRILEYIKTECDGQLLADLDERLRVEIAGRGETV
jgi:hypothetical protein